MKTYKNIFGSLILSLALLASCRDDSKIIYDTSKLPTGVYARLLSQPPSDVDPTTATFDATAFPFTAEVVGVSAATDITSFDVQVRLLDKDAKVLKPYASLGSINSFSVNTSTQLPQGTGSFAGSAVRTALNLTSSDLKQGNQLEFSTSLKLKDGRTFDATNFDPNMANTFYGAAYDYISLIDDPAPAPTLNWRNGNTNDSKSVALKNGMSDTLDIVFDKAIATLPTVIGSHPYLTLSSVVYNNADKKDSKKKYYVIATGAASGTGAVNITVSGAVASDGNVMSTAKTTRDADNQAPVASLSWSVSAIGRGQSAAMTLSFNEPMATAPKVTISGQNQDGVTNASMTLAGDGMSAIFLYGYKNNNAVDNTTSGTLTVTLSGGTDLAGNALQAGLLSSTDLATDVTQPGLPTVAPDGVQYDWGTQLKLAASVSGYGDGTVYYIAVVSGTTAPTQASGTVSGVAVKAGFDTSNLTAANIATQGSFNLNDTFIPFTVNGTLDVYFYFVSTTGNVSANTSTPVTITMQ